MPFDLKSLIVEHEECLQSFKDEPTTKTATRLFWLRRIDILRKRIDKFGKRYNCVSVSFIEDLNIPNCPTRTILLTDVTIKDAQLYVLGKLNQSNTEIISAEEIKLGL